jgi:phosphofructokinase-like protein
MRKIGILTGGGDCPGLNAVIRSVVEKCAAEGAEVFGFSNGWRGVIDNEGRWLAPEDVEGIQTIGGTIIGTSRTNVLRIENGTALVQSTMEARGLESIVAIGGDDTLGIANELQKIGLNMVGVPKTIDNDLSGTDFTFGFDSAANIAMRALDDIKHTAISHRRILVVEMMGRETGWITVQAGIAGDAHVIAIPEFPMHIDEICAILQRRFERGLPYGIVAVAEAAEIAGVEVDEGDIPCDMFGNIAMDKRGIGEKLACAIHKRTGLETRSVVLGHLQRGGNPSCFDRVLAARLGYVAAEQALSGNFGVMAALTGGKVTAIPLEAALGERKCVDEALYNVARAYSR